MKKILLLGGLRYLIPVIKKAHELGLYVITCDNVPHNIAHKYADEFVEASILDKELILSIAKEKQINGIMSFAVDPGVLTGAYVAEQLGLPYAGSFEAISILQNKNLFREFLEKNGFNVPFHYCFKSFEEAAEVITSNILPIIVKPTDSAGSKGVTKVENLECLQSAFIYAKEKSFSGNVIIEEFIEQDGFSSDSDCFSLDGKLVFSSFSDQFFEKNVANPYTPAGYLWPSSITKEHQETLKKEIQRLLTLLNLKSSVYNIESRVSKSGVPYLMEVSPRGGGNRICELLRMATHIDLIEAAIKVAIGETIEIPSAYRYDGYWSQMVLFSNKNGIFEGIEIEDDLRKYIKEEDLWITPGDEVHCFTGANETIGTLVLRFESKEEAMRVWCTARQHIHIRVK